MTESTLLFGIVLPAAAVLFALPIGLAPVSWARAFQWNVQPQADPGAHAQERNLCVYFARCVAALVLAFGAACAVAAWTTGVPPVLGMQAIVLGAGLTLVHIVGALQRTQPWTEDAEILFYGALTAWAVHAYPPLG